MLAAKNAYEALDTHDGRDFLLLFRAHHINIRGFPTGFGFTYRPPADFLSLHCLGLEAKAEESLVSDLRSLVIFAKDESGDLRLYLYHKSFSDFLEEESRAKELFVPAARVHAHIAKCFMQHVIDCQLDFDSGA